MLHVAESGYYAWRDRPLANCLVKHAWLTEAIVGIHTASRGTRGVHAELRLGLSIHVSRHTVELLMQRAGLHGLPGNRRPAPSTSHPRLPTWWSATSLVTPGPVTGHRHHRAPHL
ncbi:IS3 family transposase [Streptomyces fulvoviolaceus]|uniref:IS3 family transposase n=1 Tax=Streptomyces fulvoviolaceus TaxID=285535 RepID=UPI000B21A1C4|nr:IS3 family transposase [Streptomyces fulvoviolaceus]